MLPDDLRGNPGQQDQIMQNELLLCCCSYRRAAATTAKKKKRTQRKRIKVEIGTSLMLSLYSSAVCPFFYSHQRQRR